jgi:hypothetical protein
MLDEHAKFYPVTEAIVKAGLRTYQHYSEVLFGRKC